MKAEVSDLRQEVSDLSKRVAMIDRELAPAWTAENEIRAGIRATHGIDPLGKILYAVEGIVARRPLFERLLEISIECGPVRQQRRELAQRMRAYERRASRLTRDITREEKRNAKKAST